MTQRIGFLGGTFDPPTLGHLHLGISLQEACDLDEVWFSPAQISPHKLDQPPVSVDHRIQMVEKAIEGARGFRVHEWEAQQEGPSFTVRTLETFREQDAQQGLDRKYFLLLGDDCLQGFRDWKEVERLVELVQPLIACRRHGLEEMRSEVEAWEDGPVKASVMAGMVEVKQVAIDSTEVRERLGEGKFCHHLVRAEVLDYIKENRLYS